MTAFKIMYVVSVILALAAGYFAGKKYNPRPAKQVVQKITEQKTIEKVVKYDVVVEKEISSIPNFVDYKGQQLDCSEVAKIKLMLPKSRWSKKQKTTNEAEAKMVMVGSLLQESMYTVAKADLLKKVKCRSNLNPDELQLLNELVKRQDVIAEFL